MSGGELQKSVVQKVWMYKKVIHTYTHSLTQTDTYKHTHTYIQRRLLNQQLWLLMTTGNTPRPNREFTPYNPPLFITATAEAAG